MRIIDAHTHIYPSKIAMKASESIGKFYDIPMRFDGTVSKLLEVGERAGIEKFLIHSVATSPAQIDSINRFISDTVASAPDKFIGFATLHPEDESIREHVDTAVSLGLQGIKLHPDFQKFNIDSDRAMRIYEEIENRLPVLFHAGDFRTEYSKPSRIVNVMKTFPKLRVIAAHFGGWSEWGNDAKELAAQGVYVDTSSSLYTLSDERVRALIEIFGSSHVFFGSDYPMWDAADDIQRLNKILDENEQEAVYHANLERFLEI